MIRKILVANRGEIACRVIRTARRLDIRTVAIHSEEDSHALHVDWADEAVLVGPAPAAQSYNAIDNVLAAMKETGADAVHPGYGFLSENTEFAEAVAAAGATFIGPPPKAIAVMGDKIESKKLAQSAGVNTIPGYLDVIRDSEDAVRIARKVGYPVMIKAAAGGGGKGMRIAHDDEEAREGFDRASSEARTAFSDDRIFIEKFIESPRHIEIQVLADTHGHIIYLGERECSIQRRHQKVVEESPSVFIDAETRRRMGEQAVALARAVGYVSAGTVEFVVDRDRQFYFLEMNTRLQVEHPVTEKVTGVDLVEEMIRIAQGEPLSLRQEDVTLTGWAIECRVYAENPFNQFLPSTGQLSRYLPPEENEHVRVDTGVIEGRQISIYYDPMIAKLISYGETRAEAIETMRHALDEFYIAGVAHNISFLAAIMAHPRFIAGELTTHFVDEEYPDGFQVHDVPPEDPHLLTAVAAAVHACRVRRSSQISGQLPGYKAELSPDWIVQVNREQHAVRVLARSGGFDVLVHGETFEVRSCWTPGQPLFRASINDKPVCVQVDLEGLGYRLFHGGAMTRALVLRPRAAELYAYMPVKEPPDMSRFLLSPMPGLVLSVNVELGEHVKAGQMLAIVEAMKMENVLRAVQDAVVANVLARPGDSVAVGQALLEFED